MSSLPKITKAKKRVGRGGKFGKNAGKGDKGQNKRGGNRRVGFEGGQESLIRRLPKLKGFKMPLVKKRDLVVISLTILNKNFSDGEIVSLETLLSKGLISNKIKRVRVTNTGQKTNSFTFAEDIYITAGVKALN